jgi:hypothetical protein
VAVTDVRGIRPWPAAAAVIGYAVLALLARGLTGGEVYPFFTWDLFSRIPGEQLRATLYLEAVAGERLDEPEPLFGSGYSRGSDIVGNQLVASLVTALRDDAEQTRRLVAALRSQHLPPEATWSVVWERYDPLDRIAGQPPATFEAARFGPPPGYPPDDHRLVRDAGVVIAPEGRFELVGTRTGVITQLAAWGEDERDLRLSGWAGDPETGVLPIRIVVFSGAEPLGYAGVGASGRLAVETTGEPGLARAGFSRVLPSEHLPDELDDLTVVALFADGTARPIPTAEGVPSSGGSP